MQLPSQPLRTWQRVLADDVVFAATWRGLPTVQARAYLVPEVMHALRVVLGVQDERNLPTPATTPHASLRRLAAEEEKKKDRGKDGPAAVGTDGANADGAGSPHQLHIHWEAGDSSDDACSGLPTADESAAWSIPLSVCAFSASRSLIELARRNS